jgi:oligosaccharide repeat unit polymerase
MSAVFAAFVLPQAISLIRAPGLASPSAVDAVMLMTLLCVIACILGYRARPNKWIVDQCQIPVDERKMFHCGLAFITCAYFFTYMIISLPDAEKNAGMWTGRATIYGFFAGLMYPGFAICLARALKYGRLDAWLVTVTAGIPSILGSLLGGRRETTVLLAVTIALTLYYQRRYVLPRLVVVGAIIAAMIAIPATGNYRSAIRRSGLSGLQNIDVVGNFNRFMSSASILELRNAAMMIEATANTGDYGLGRAYWDQLVFRFVPAQIVGLGVKEGLMFRSAEGRTRQEFAATGYKVPVGTTVTGMGDSFREFGYFGALFFAVLAVVFKSVWTASLPRDAVFAQLLYIQTTTSAMRAITHQTSDYLPGLVYNLIFLGLAAIYSRQRRSHDASTQSPSVASIAHAYP